MLVLLLGIFGLASAQAHAQRVTRIDDSDVYSLSNPTGIQYSQTWLHFSGDKYRRTFSVTNADNASAVHFFKGNYIAYYANPVPLGTNVSVSVDGLTPEIVRPGNSSDLTQPLWSMSNLDEGDHQVIISRSSGSLGSMTLDYFEVTYNETTNPLSLGPGAINSAELVSILDDDDPRITYTGDWLTWDSTARSFFYGGHQRVSQTPGSSVTFSFNGTSAWYFADKNAANGRLLVSIDGGEGDIVSTTLSSSDKRWLSQALCWSKTGLSDGPHTVNVTHWDGPWVGFDFFAYSSTTTSEVSNKANNVSVAAIVGSAIGGAAALCLTLALYLLYRRGRRQAQQKAQQEKFSDSDSDSMKSEYTISKPGDLPVYTLSYQTQR